VPPAAPSGAHPPRKNRIAAALRVAFPSTLILFAGVVAAAIVLRAPARLAVTPPPQESPPPAPAPVVAAAPAQAEPAPPPAREPDPPPPRPESPRTTLVTLTSTPSGAEVRDAADRFLGTTPFDLRVPSGKPLQLALRHHGYRPAWVNRNADGERMSVNVKMRDAKAGPYESKPTKRSVGYKEDPY
jgi:hypothetical protein